MHMTKAIAKVRRDIGDPPRTLNSSALADGMTLYYDLPLQMINPLGLTFMYQVGSQSFTVYPQTIPGTASEDDPDGDPAFPAYSPGNAYQIGSQVSYNGNYFIAYAPVVGPPPVTNTANQWWNNVTTYSLDFLNGGVTTSNFIPNNAQVVITGSAWSMFTDQELTEIIHDSVRQHCQGQTLNERFQDLNGFITYRDTPKELHNLPHMEEDCVVKLTDVNCLWIMATDLATNINIDTVENTNINYAAMYNQLMAHIEALTDRYKQLCGELGVGMFRIEVLQLRRKSRTTNRLVPIYREREYDDHRYPQRKLPQIDRRDEDNSGVPSPVWNGLPL